MSLSLDRQSKTGDCAIFFAGANYGTDGTSNHYANVCSSIDPNGIMPTANNSKWKFENQLSSVKVDYGMLLTLYTKTQYGGNKTTIKGGDYPSLPGWNDKAYSYTLQKDCSDLKWIWDTDCDNSAQLGNDTYNTANVKSQALNRANVCSAADLSLDSNCNDWCFKNPSSCSNSIQTYCSDNNYIKSSACQNWGKKPDNKTYFDGIVTKYCAANLTENDFCSCFEDNARYKLSPAELKLLASGNSGSSTNNRAICWSKKCGDGGWQTDSMPALVKGCPTCYQVSYDNITTITDNVNSTINAGLVQSCNVSTSSNSVVNNSVSSSTPDTTSTSSTSNSSTPDTTSTSSTSNSSTPDTTSTSSTSNSSTPDTTSTSSVANVSTTSSSVVEIIVILTLIFVAIFVAFAFKKKQPMNYQPMNYQPMNYQPINQQQMNYMR